MATDTQKIVPHLWFDNNAQEAVEFYCSIFPPSWQSDTRDWPGSRITNITTLHDTPGGDTQSISFELEGHSFMAINGGPAFKVNPSVSFVLNFDPLRYGGADEGGEPAAREHLDTLWEQLAEGGQVLMPLDAYPYSERYGWVQDRFGISWQLMLTDPEGEPRPFIIPSLLFVGDVAGKAEEATDFYLSLFKNSRRGQLARIPNKGESDAEKSLIYTDFMLENQWFVAMDSPNTHDFDFNEGISLMVLCEDQDEIDYFWNKLSAVPEAEQCGWLKDKYGLSWQITPRVMLEMMAQGSREQIDRLTQAFLPMKKLDIQTLKEAWNTPEQPPRQPSPQL